MTKIMDDGFKRIFTKKTVSAVLKVFPNGAFLLTHTNYRVCSPPIPMLAIIYKQSCDISLRMTFDNEDDAYNYYIAYGRRVGFSVRKNRENKDRSGVLKKKKFCCSCEEETRYGYKAMLEIKLNLERKFVVTNFVAEHGHVLVPASSSHLLRSQRLIEPSQEKLIDQQMHSAGLQPSQIFSYFTTEKKQNEDKSFFYSLQTNEENEISAIILYLVMLCVLIRHSKRIDIIWYGETIDACEWLFKAFLQAIDEKAPGTIFTDQAQSIAAAISEVFPNCHHRLYLWHIYQNAVWNLNHVSSEFKSFTQDLKRCIYDPETLLDDYELRGNDWLEGIYLLCEKWAQVYGRDHFCAGITLDQFLLYYFYILFTSFFFHYIVINFHFFFLRYDNNTKN
ncbi:hypothetical protein D8674_018896 [Pyrus ussuriensis x Pyrus communis]|uniref:Protein FAR1-RELATED SEQUENCE n=1 Tax=Pyrus ussuriensis x Pyrus communis TaxID=2448454 RepID=A0A5N5GJC8_9ROSA|nr:hypothetical protein D8674_018896 [Pyrus ussuriensis x Pyrus communis]